MCRTKRNLGRDEAASWHSGTDDRVRRQVLFEGDDPAEAYAVSRVVDALGADTMWCPGPRADRGALCPMVEQGHCDLVEKADVVINNLGTTDPRCAAVARAVDHTVTNKRVVVLTTPRDVEVAGPELQHSEVVPGPLTRERVRTIVETT